MTRDILVLVVDDEPALRDLTADLLERVSDEITVRTEADPTMVTDRVRAEPIDCVVSDYRMPRLDGLELCSTLRRSHPHLPFFLLTSSGDPTVIERALERNATDYIQKQPGIEHYRLLANRIERAVQHHRDRSRLAELVSGA